VRSPDFRLQSGRLAFGARVAAFENRAAPEVAVVARSARSISMSSRGSSPEHKARVQVHPGAWAAGPSHNPLRDKLPPDRAGGHPVGRERTPSPLRSDPRRDAKPRGARSRDLERQLERCLQICQVNLSILYSLERRVDSVFSKRGSEARAARDRRLCPNSPFPRIRPIAALPRGADRRDARCRIAFPSACPSHILSCSGRGVAALERRNRQHPRKSRAERRKRD